MKSRMARLKHILLGFNVMASQIDIPPQEILVGSHRLRALLGAAGGGGDVVGGEVGGPVGAQRGRSGSHNFPPVETGLPQMARP